MSARLRLRRKELGLGQGTLGEKIGVTFQQIQKYEAAKSRISAGILYGMGKALGVPITYFFEDCETGSMKGRKRKATKSLRLDQLNAENDG